MTNTIHINKETLEIDTAKTQEFYLTQHKIIEDCECDDCNFYATNFVKNDLEIFDILTKMGVDLSKNLTTEPTGVWCVRDDNGKFLHCQQVYQAIGQFKTDTTSKITYEKIENNLKVVATIIKADKNKIDIELLIDIA